MRPVVEILATEIAVEPAVSQDSFVYLIDCRCGPRSAVHGRVTNFVSGFDTICGAVDAVLRRVAVVYVPF
jgi:hypothetical protein